MSRKMRLRSSTGETFEVDEAVAFKSQTIKDLFGENSAGTVIPILEITGPILAKVIEYCEKHVNETNLNDDELKWWDEEDFIESLNKATLFDLILAADYLCIQSLLNLTCDHVSHTIHQFTPQQVRTYYSTRQE